MRSTKIEFVIKGGGWLWIAEKGPEFEPFPSDSEAALPVGSDDLILGVTKTVLSDLLVDPRRDAKNNEDTNEDIVFILRNV